VILLFTFLTLTAWGQDPEVVDVQAEITEQHLEVVDLKFGLMALDYFLTDEEEYKKIKTLCECDLKWAQPSLEVYKPDPKSLLPAEVLILAGEAYVYPAPALELPEEGLGPAPAAPVLPVLPLPVVEVPALPLPQGPQP